MTYSEPQPDKMTELVAVLQLVVAAQRIVELTGGSTYQTIESIKKDASEIAKSLNREQITELIKVINQEKLIEL